MNADEMKQLKKRLGIRKKLLDDVFHNMIIALERLEAFLEFQRNGNAAVKFHTTGMYSSRDLHDDMTNPPTRESVLGEVQLQCSALFFQTKFDDEKLFKQTMKYFMTDLLEWYGGRGKEIPYDEVEMYILPILVSLSRQIDSVLDIMQVCDDYVSKIRRIEDFSDEEKEKAVEEGFRKYLEATHIVGKTLHEFAESGKDVFFSVHQRGSAVDGYTRLIDAMLKLYGTTTPAKKVRAIFNAYVDNLPEVDDVTIEKAISAKMHIQKFCQSCNNLEGVLENKPADNAGDQEQRNDTADAQNAEQIRK